MEQLGGDSNVSLPEFKQYISLIVDISNIMLFVYPFAFKKDGKSPQNLEIS